MAESKRTDLALEQDSDGILLVLPGKSKLLLVIFWGGGNGSS